MPTIARRETHEIGAWRITLMYDSEGNVIAAVVEPPRGRSTVISKGEKVKLKAPKKVLAFLQRHGFNVEKGE